MFSNGILECYSGLISGPRSCANVNRLSKLLNNNNASRMQAFCFSVEIFVQTGIPWTNNVIELDCGWEGKCSFMIGLVNCSQFI